MNFLSYPMWNIINTFHVNTTCSLYPTGLQGQIDKHSQRGQINPHIRVENRPYYYL